jgi:hypothetical protein
MTARAAAIDTSSRRRCEDATSASGVQRVPARRERHGPLR